MKFFFKLKTCKLFFILISSIHFLIFFLFIQLFIQSHNYLQNNEQFTHFDSDIYLYSAYCIDSKIIIISIIKNNISSEYNCELIDGKTVNAQIIELPEHHYTIYR
jgi:hypothetical protein